MNKKNIIIFGILAIAAICSAFLIVKSFVSSDIEKNTNTETKYSQDFISVENSTSDTKANEDIDNDQKAEGTINNTAVNNEKTNESTEVNEPKSEIQNSEAYQQYYENAINEGIFDLSDVGNTVLNNYENVYTNERKVDESEIKFFNDLRNLADSYTVAYQEALSYLFSSDYDSLETYLKGDYAKVIEEFNTLDTLGNEKFEKIKNDYYNGMLKAQEGFNIYIKNPGTEDSNQSFLDSDKYFYKGQDKLIELLEEYKN